MDEQITLVVKEAVEVETTVPNGWSEYDISVKFRALLSHKNVSSIFQRKECVFIKDPGLPPWLSSVVSFHVPDDAVLIDFVPSARLSHLTFGMSTQLSVIGYEAFFGGAPNLETVIIPGTVSQLCDKCFQECPNLRCVMFDMPSQLLVIGAAAFARTAIEEIVLPDSVYELGSKCFFGCEHLRRVMCRNIERIGSKCFAYTGLEQFVIPRTLRVIDGSALALCQLPGGIRCADDSCFMAMSYMLFNKDATRCYGSFGNLTRIVVPGSVRELDENCFRCCKRLLHVYFDTPSSLEHIGAWAFSKAGFVKIHIPDKVRELGEGCFFVCNGLDCVKFGSESSLEVIGPRAFKRSGIRHITLPDSVRKLCDSCFRECRRLTQVEIGESSLLEDMGNRTFAGSALKSITIPDRIREIPRSCFASCSSLVDVKFSPASSLEVLGPYAFRDTGIITFRVPAKVREICDCCFYCMFGRITFECMDSLERVSPTAFKALRTTQKINLPPTCKRCRDAKSSD